MSGMTKNTGVRASTGGAQYTSIGGQAVIEGVMMRSPRFLAVAVRTPDQKILIKEQEWKGFSQRYPFLKKPFLRGVVSLIESMMNGVESLSYSANVAAIHAAPESEAAQGAALENKEGLSSVAIFMSMATAFLMGMLLFVALPHLITLFLGRWGLFENGIASPFFHLVDGFIKVLFLVSYVAGISLMKDIYRVFQYHGAEHKSIYTFEMGEELNIENAKRHTTLHPRCGTSFLLFLLVSSILIFSVVFPIVGGSLSTLNPFFKQGILILVKIGLMFPVAGVSYEFIRFSAKCSQNPIMRVFMAPGLLLQRLTTKEPTNDQLEVALASLKRVLYLEKHPEALSTGEISVNSLNDIGTADAKLAEFLG